MGREKNAKRSECVVARGTCLLLAIALGVRTLIQTRHEGISGKAPTVCMLLENKSCESRIGAIVLRAASLLLVCLKSHGCVEVLKLLHVCISSLLFYSKQRLFQAKESWHGTGFYTSWCIWLQTYSFTTVRY